MPCARSSTSQQQQLICIFALDFYGNDEVIRVLAAPAHNEEEPLRVRSPAEK